MDGAERNRLGFRPLDFGIGRLFYVIPDGIIVCDRNGRIVLWNPAATAIFGHTEDEALGGNVTMLIPSSHVTLHNAGMHRFASTGTGPLTSSAKVVPLPAVAKGGAEVHIDLRIAVAPTTEPFPDGPFAMAILRDANEKFQASVARPIVRRLVAALIEHAGVDRAALTSAGRSLADGVEGTALLTFLQAYRQMGLGELRATRTTPSRHEFEGLDLIERREGARLTTCYLTLGFLTGAVERALGAPALGTETACQSRGNPACLFSVHARDGDSLSQKGP